VDPDPASSLNIAIAKWLERKDACVQFERCDADDPSEFVCFIDCAAGNTFCGGGRTPHDALLDALDYARTEAGIDL
jgi:hypothetical protein